MADGSPKFTMVKSQELGGVPEGLSDKSLGLMNTLSMLCSFHSSEDLASFLHSEMFEHLTRQGEVWIGFEIGLYEDHTKTFAVFPSKNDVVFADNSATGAFPENLYRCTVENKTAEQLEHWYSIVHSPDARFE
ncbi:MAG: hypothetical protein P8R00_06445 [Candidatus Poseidoniaceae archaeon]|nr:hypothetical protein [Candidatus Poseidoniaceae archaeon]